MSQDPRLVVEPPLAVFTEGVRQARAISWYRSPLPAGELKRLHRKSDWLGAAQTMGYLAVLAIPAVLALTTVGKVHWGVTAGLIFLYGTVAHFLINGVHELIHGTVFETRRLNNFFAHLLAFLGWINHEMFQVSHVRHHRYTLHPPDDLEVRLPIRLAIRDYLKAAIIDWPGLRWALPGLWRIARGKFAGEWELTLFPPDQPGRRKAPVRWARTILGGHLCILLVSVVTGQWLIPVIFSAGPFCGAWLFWLCNNTQHIGLRDNVPDFRLCCRTFTVNPIIQFLYWHMNFHTEHHMFAAVPCYRLGRLHRLIREDLPPTPHGLVAVWKEIGAIMVKMSEDPQYQHYPPLPAPAAHG